jgi:TatD DNase family protein
MIDVHAHLCFGDFDIDRDQIIARSRQELAAVVIGTARFDEGVKALDLAKKHPGFLFPTIGYHPVEGGNDPGQIIRMIESNRERIVGVGEVGLDHHWEKDAKKQHEQKEIFLKFIDVAERIKKPLVIHSWDAESQCFEMTKGTNAGVIFHCFSGDRELAKEIAKNGFFISVSTMVLFSKNVRKIAKDVPLENLLLETDSPFLSPNKEVDPRNYPWNIKLSARKIAELKGLDAGHILQRAKDNAARVFGLEVI